MPSSPFLADRGAQSYRPESHVTDPVVSLVSGVLDEMLNSGALTAAASSIANAALARHASVNEGLVAIYLPPLPSLFPQARLQLCIMPRTCALSILLSSYFDRLAFLCDLTRNRIEHVQSAAADQSFAPIARAWRMLAADALEALPEFGRLQMQTNEQQVRRMAQTIELLTRAESGGWPCVDAYGSIKRPFWTDRRSTNRTEKNILALFAVGDSLQRASVVNASRTGLCVQGLKGIWVAARISLLVAPGRSIAGSVVWCKEDKAGIALDDVIPVDSQLLSHLH